MGGEEGCPDQARGPCAKLGKVRDQGDPRDHTRGTLRFGEWGAQGPWTGPWPAPPPGACSATAPGVTWGCGHFHSSPRIAALQTSCPRGRAWWVPWPGWACPAGEGGTRQAHRAVIPVEVGSGREPSGWGPRRSRLPWGPLPGSILPTDPVPGEVTVGRGPGSHAHAPHSRSPQCLPSLLAHWRVQ